MYKLESEFVPETIRKIKIMLEKQAWEVFEKKELQKSRIDYLCTANF
jgi:hypothetical protein